MRKDVSRAYVLCQSCSIYATFEWMDIRLDLDGDDNDASVSFQELFTYIPYEYSYLFVY